MELLTSYNALISLGTALFNLIKAVYNSQNFTIDSSLTWLVKLFEYHNRGSSQ